MDEYLVEVEKKSEEYIKEWTENTAEIHRKTEEEAAKRAEERYDKHPDLMVIWNPGMDTGLLYSIDRWDITMKCDDCGVGAAEGAYVIAGDHNSPGICEQHLKAANESDNKKNKIKNILKLVVLPYKHDYPDAKES